MREWPWQIEFQRAAGIALLVLVSCTSPKESKSVEDAGKAPVVVDATVVKQAEARAPQAFHGGDDEATALLAASSLPAWSALLERYRLLERRKQVGLTHGLLIREGTELRLVDESEGQGSLSIPVRLPALTQLEPPVRVVLRGAWRQEEGSYVWQATQVETLGSAPAPIFAPGLTARDKQAPEVLQLSSTASRRGGAISFSVHQRLDRIGDGWLIADHPGLPPSARLFLPGEREPYGDQTQVAESERWHLKGDHHYWIEIRPFRPARAGLPVYRAQSVPFRLPTQPAAEPAKN